MIRTSRSISVSRVHEPTTGFVVSPLGLHPVRSVYVGRLVNPTTISVRGQPE